MCSIITAAPEGCFGVKKKSLGHKEKQLSSPAAHFSPLLFSFRFFFLSFSPFIARTRSDEVLNREGGPVLCQASPSAADDCYVLLQLLADGQFALPVNRFAQLFFLLFLPIKCQDCSMSTPE